MEKFIQISTEGIKFIAVCNDCKKLVGEWRNTRKGAEDDGDVHTNEPGKNYHTIKIAIQDIR